MDPSQYKAYTAGSNGQPHTEQVPANSIHQNGSAVYSITVDMPSGQIDGALWSGGQGKVHSKSTLSKIANGLPQDASTPARHSSNHANKKRVVVLGSGDFGLALTGRLMQANYDVVVGSRNPQRARQRVLDAGATIMQTEAALQQSVVVVVAVPFTHVAALPLSLLAGKIVIDVSNRTSTRGKFQDLMSNAEQLQVLVPNARVVKAFNVLSAYALTHGSVGSKEVPVCGDDEEARSQVCEMARDLRLSPLDMGRLANAREVESIPLRFFPEWHGAFAFSLVIWIAFFLLLVFEWQVCDNIMDSTSDWTSLGLLASTNVPLACGDTALTLLAVCYLPGVIAAYLQLTRGTKYSQFPGWLDRWLKSRKQLGLLMLLNALLHTLVMFCNSESQLSWTSSWHKNTFLACGCYAILLAGILGLTSLPSVSGNMTWREFSFVQSVLGWLTLLLATLHLVFCYWDKLIKADFKCYLPSSGQFVIVIPLLTIVLKLPLLLPCVDSVLTNIRQGYERPSSHSRTPNNTIN